MFSARTRDMAAKICSIAANNAASGDRKNWCWGSTQTAIELGATRAAKRLAHLAWAEAVLTARPFIDSHIRYAEAEALIRSGWTPEGYR